MSVPFNVVYLNGSTTPVSADGLNTMVQVVASVAGLRLFTGTANQVIWLEGTASPNDGGQSLYFYNATSTAADNGSSVIAPFGSTIGRWIQTTPYVGPASFGWAEATVSSNQSPTVASAQTVYVATSAINITLPLTTGLTNKFNLAVYAQGGNVTLTPQSADRINGAALGASLLLEQYQSCLLTTDANGNWWLLFQGSRTVLQSPLNLYISASGSDTNSGLSTAAPLQTLQRAWSVLQTQYDCNLQPVTLNALAGTFTSGISMSGSCVGQGSISLVGAGAGTTIINAASGNAVSAVQGASISQVTGLTLTSVAGWGVQVNEGQIGSVNNVTFGTCGIGHLNAQNGAALGCSTYTITGGATYHWLTQSGSSLTASGVITLANTPAITTFAYSNLTANIQAPSGTVSFTGTGATGTRYLASLNSVIFVNGGGASFLPGNAAGSTATGGQYV